MNKVLFESWQIVRSFQRMIVSLYFVSPINTSDGEMWAISSARSTQLQKGWNAITKEKKAIEATVFFFKVEIKMQYYKAQIKKYVLKVDSIWPLLILSELWKRSMCLTFVPENICVNMPLDPYVTIVVKSHALFILFREEINTYLRKHLRKDSCSWYFHLHITFVVKGCVMSILFHEQINIYLRKHLCNNTWYLYFH